jgi:rubrerythrin
MKDLKSYKSEASINRILAQLQMAGVMANDPERAEEKEESFEVLLREAIKSENEAIEIYLKLKEKAEALGSELLVKAFEEIKNDEEAHVGNLNYLISILCQKAFAMNKDGEEEEIKTQLEPED